MREKSVYYVVGRNRALEPVDIRVHEDLIIPPRDNKLLPEPLEIKCYEKVDNISKLPVGSIVEKKGDKWLYHLIVRKQWNIDKVMGREGVLDFFEKRMLDKILEAYEQKFRVRSNAKETPLYNLLLQDVRKDVIDGVKWIPQDEADILSGILEEMKEDGIIRNQIERKFAKDLTNAVRTRQR